MNDNHETNKPCFAFAASRIFSQAGAAAEAAVMGGLVGAVQLRDVCDGAALRLVELHEDGAPYEELRKFVQETITEVRNAADVLKSKYAKAA